MSGVGAPKGQGRGPSFPTTRSGVYTNQGYLKTCKQSLVLEKAQHPTFHGSEIRRENHTTWDGAKTCGK